jgi:hypothetical protein
LDDFPSVSKEAAIQVIEMANRRETLQKLMDKIKNKINEGDMQKINVIT